MLKEKDLSVIVLSIGDLDFDMFMLVIDVVVVGFKGGDIYYVEIEGWDNLRVEIVK